MHLKNLSKLVNLGVAILISKTEEKSNIFSILCFIASRKVKTQLKHTKKICALYGKRVVTDRTCQKLFAKFRAGDFSLDDAPWLGRPDEVDGDRIKALTENKQCYTTQEIANILKISKSSDENHLHQLGYVHHFDVWVPHKLSKKNLLNHYFLLILY